MPSVEVLRNLLDNNIAVHIEGNPGGGKTESVLSLARGCDAHAEVTILSAREPSDVAGLPVQTERGVVFMMPGYAYRLDQASKAGKRTIWVGDEYSTASPSIQAPSLRLIHERRMDDWALPGPDSPGGACRVVLISNPKEVAAGGYDLTPPAANRVAHFDWQMTYSIWSEWAMRSTDDPPKWTMAKDPATEYAARWQQSLARIAGFLKARNLLFQLPEDPEARSKAWPSPRTWTLASRVEFDPEAMACLVGTGAAAEYLQWKNQADLPDPEEVLAGKAKLPTREDALYACIMQIVALAKADEKKQPRAWELILGMPSLDLKIPPARALTASCKIFPPQVVKLLPEIERIVK